MSIRNIRRVRNQPRQQGEAAIPTMSFDDSNRENYIMRSSRGLPTLFDRAKDVAPIQIFPPNPNPNIIVDYEEGRGGRDSSMLPDFSAPIEEILERDLMIPEVEGISKYRETLDESLTPIGLLGPGRGLGDPTGEGGIIQKLGELFGLIDPIDPENDGLPMDEGLPLPDDFKGGLPPGSMTETLEASADTYTLPNLLQMLEDARNAGNEDEIELLTNDLEMLFPGSTMTI